MSNNYAKYKDLGDNNPKMNKQTMESLCPSITTLEQKQQFISNNKICVIDIYGDWCGPCKEIAPAYAELSKKYGRSGICLLCKEDIDLNLTQNIKGVPMFLFYKNGQFVDSVTGADLTGNDGVESKLVALLQGP
jgi:thiol-disulfide isomerase/thioredoxin